MACSTRDAASQWPAPTFCRRSSCSCLAAAARESHVQEASPAVPPSLLDSSSADTPQFSFLHTQCDDEAHNSHVRHLFSPPPLHTAPFHICSPAADAYASHGARPSAGAAPDYAAAVAAGPSAPAAHHDTSPRPPPPFSAGATFCSRSSATATARCIPRATAAAAGAGLAVAAATAPDAGAAQAASAAWSSPRASAPSPARRLLTSVCSWPGTSCCSSGKGEMSDGRLLLLLSLSAASPHFFRHFLAAFQLYLTRDPALHYSNVYHGLLLSLLELPAIPAAFITGACSSSSSYSSHRSNNCSSLRTRRSSSARKSSRHSCASDSSFPSCAAVPFLEDCQPLVSLPLQKDATVSCGSSSSSHCSVSGSPCPRGSSSNTARGRHGSVHCSRSSSNSSGDFANGSWSCESEVRGENSVRGACVEEERQRLSCSAAEARVSLPATAPLLLVAASLVCWIGQLLFSLSLVLFSSFAAAAVAVAVAGAGGGAVVVLQRAALVTLFPQTPAAAIAMSVACSATAKALGRVGPAAAAATFAAMRHARASDTRSSGEHSRGGNVTAWQQHDRASQQQEVQRVHLNDSAAPEEHQQDLPDIPTVGEYRVLLLGAALVCGVSVAAACCAASFLRRIQAAAAQKRVLEEAEAATESEGGDEEAAKIAAAAGAGRFGAADAEESGATVAEAEAAAAEAAAAREERDNNRTVGGKDEEAQQKNGQRGAAGTSVLPIVGTRSHAEVSGALRPSSSGTSGGSTGSSRSDREEGADVNFSFLHLINPVCASSTEFEALSGPLKSVDTQPGVLICSARRQRAARRDHAEKWQHHERGHQQLEKQEPQPRRAEEQQRQWQWEKTHVRRTKMEKEQQLLQKWGGLQGLQQRQQERVEQEHLDEERQEEKRMKQQRMQGSEDAHLQPRQRLDVDEEAAAERRRCAGSCGESGLTVQQLTPRASSSTDGEGSSSGRHRLGSRMAHISNSSRGWCSISRRSRCNQGVGAADVRESARGSDDTGSAGKSSSTGRSTSSSSIKRRSVSDSGSGVARVREMEPALHRDVERHGSNWGWSRPRKIVLRVHHCWLRSSWQRELLQHRQSVSKSNSRGRRKSFPGTEGSLGSSFWLLVVLHALTVATGHCFLSFSASIFHRVYRTTFVHAAVFAAIITVTTFVVLPAVAYIVDRCGGSLAVVGVGLLLMWLVFCGTIAVHRAHQPSTASEGADGTKKGETYPLVATAAPVTSLFAAFGAATAKPSATARVDKASFASPHARACHWPNAVPDATTTGDTAAAQTLAAAEAQGRRSSTLAHVSSPVPATAALVTAGGEEGRLAGMQSAESRMTEEAEDEGHARSMVPSQADDTAAAADTLAGARSRALAAGTRTAAADSGTPGSAAVGDKGTAASVATQAATAATAAAAVAVPQGATLSVRTAAGAATQGSSTPKFAFDRDVPSPRNRGRAAAVVAVTTAVVPTDARGSRSLFTSGPEGAAADGSPRSLSVADARTSSSTAARKSPDAASEFDRRNSTSPLFSGKRAVAASPSVCSPTGKGATAFVGSWSLVGKSRRNAALAGEPYAGAGRTAQAYKTRARSTAKDSAAAGATAVPQCTNRGGKAEGSSNPPAAVVVLLDAAVQSTPGVKCGGLTNGSSSKLNTSFINSNKDTKNSTLGRIRSRKSARNHSGESSSKSSISSLDGKRTEDRGNSERRKRLKPRSSSSRDNSADSPCARLEDQVESSSTESIPKQIPGSARDTGLLPSVATAGEQREERYWALVAAVVFGATEAVLPTVLLALVVQPHIVRETSMYPLAFGIIEVVKCAAVAVINGLFGFIVDHQGGSYIAGLWFLCFLTLFAVLPLALLMKRGAKEATKLCLAQRRNSLHHLSPLD